ncbi:MAG: 5-keto-L-gluconate epimerase [Bacteroidota bacterium]
MDGTICPDKQPRKTSVVVSTPNAGFSALVYREPFVKSFAKAAALGFRGVEVAIRDPKMVSAGELLHLAEEYQLKICALGTGQAYGTDGLSFTHPDQSVRRKALDRIKDHLALAAELDALVIIGLIRGKRPPEEPVLAIEGRMLEGLKACADEAVRQGADLVIEPINRYETNLLNTVGEALKILDELAVPRVGVLLDTFHMNIEERSITESIRKAGSRIKHVHVADSNRWAPGFGHLDFGAILAELRAVGYDGFLSAEILPYPDPDSAARKMVETLADL